MPNNKKLIVITVLLFISVAAVMLLRGYPQKNEENSALKTEDIVPAVSNVSQTLPEPISLIRIHTVQEGESLSSIAAKYNIDIETLYGANQISDVIHTGDQLKILPQKGILHVVQPGETLWSIARMYEVSVSAVMNANKKQDNRLAVHEELIIPGAKSAKTAVSRGIVSRMIWPTYGELSSSFGYRWGRLHAGIDIANDQGTVVKAALPGKVTYAGWQSGYGYTVVIEHSPELSTLYGHLADFVVHVGQMVAQGEIVAYMGSTGNSTGPHLHFEVQYQQHPVNPLALLP